MAGFAIIRGVSIPITAITGAMRRLAEHDMTVEIVGRYRKDEIGAMAGAVQVFKDNMLQADQLAAEEGRRAGRPGEARRAAGRTAARLRGEG